MRAPRRLWASLAVVFLLSACGDGDEAIVDGSGDVDAATVDSGGVVDAGADASCYIDPVTHLEIINACTTAQKIDKHPELPLLTDGGLPPLPE
jgi:hypothetical protein